MILVEIKSIIHAVAGLTGYSGSPGLIRFMTRPAMLV